MNHKPVIFLAFANSDTAPLFRLTEEDKVINRILHRRAVAEEHFHLHCDSHAELNTIRPYLTEYQNAVHIFHYAGHSDSESLFLQDAEAQAAGFAEMLAAQQNLKLVFLNGCANQAQVAYLLELGIPAVIATNAAINDEKAKDFAQHFYHALEVGLSIEAAFQGASSYIKALGTDSTMFRDRVPFEQPKKEAVQSWDLYCHPDKEEVLQYRLPRKARKAQESYFKPNEGLIDTLWQSLIAEGIVGEGRGKKLKQKRKAILENLPAPLAENLRKLLVQFGEEEAEGYDQIGLPRLQQLARTYQVLMELLTFTLLAQTWESKYKHPDLNMPKSLVQETRNFLALGNMGRKRYRFLPLIQQLMEVLHAQKVSFFVEELHNFPSLLQADSPFHQACLHFDVLRAALETGGMDGEDRVDPCRYAEEHLGHLLASCTFLAHYTLATIKHIDVEKYRHTPTASFRHNVVRLVDLLGGMEEEEETLDRFLDNRSVLLLKEDENEEIEDFLNLSPFIIDENAFVAKTDKSKIFFFHHFESQDNAWCYEYVNNPDDPMLQVPGAAFQVIQDQFQAFQHIFLRP